MKLLRRHNPPSSTRRSVRDKGRGKKKEKTVPNKSAQEGEDNAEEFAYLARLTFALAASPCSTRVLASILGYVAASRYEYRANSSLVLTTDSRLRDTYEPTGEPESLWGKIDPKHFDDRVYKGRPPELKYKLKKSKKKKERDPPTLDSATAAPDSLKKKHKRPRLLLHQEDNI
ncbi:hypothetical protein Syun_019386 [Stephania yunnanensis]|uniref:Uncharacterized protein n=1 Tax=Stephania yunnanensis TaxID=152371 RepID=A0AAP0IU36_9MAGN